MFLCNGYGRNATNVLNKGYFNNNYITPKND